MTGTHPRRPRAARPLVWLLAGVCVLVLLAVGALVWFFGGLPGRGDEAREEALAEVRRSADDAGQRLLTAARGDSLSEASARTILSRSQAAMLRVQDRPERFEVVAEVHAPYQTGLGSAGVSRCFRFVLTETGSPVPTLSSTELEHCPAN